MKPRANSAAPNSNVFSNIKAELRKSHFQLGNDSKKNISFILRL